GHASWLSRRGLPRQSDPRPWKGALVISPPAFRLRSYASGPFAHTQFGYSLSDYSPAATKAGFYRLHESCSGNSRGFGVARNHLRSGRPPAVGSTHGGV